MEILGLDGNRHIWNPGQSSHFRLKSVSKYHLRARNILRGLFQFDNIYEEVTLIGSKSGNTRSLTADFYIPVYNIMIEVQGEQHYKFNSHFFSTKLEYYQAIQRDKNKQKWCEINDIELVQLPYNESDDDWTKRIKNTGII